MAFELRIKCSDTIEVDGDAYRMVLYCDNRKGGAGRHWVEVHADDGAVLLSCADKPEDDIDMAYGHAAEALLKAWIKAKNDVDSVQSHFWTVMEMENDG